VTGKTVLVRLVDMNGPAAAHESLPLLRRELVLRTEHLKLFDNRSWRWPLALTKWQRAALVRARVLCQMRAPYRPITSLPLPPIAGP